MPNPDSHPDSANTNQLTLGEGMLAPLEMSNRKRNSRPKDELFIKAGSSVHLSRTLMYAEMEALFEAVPEHSSSLSAYQVAVLEQNCLHKRTASNRKSTFQFLRKLYMLNPESSAFRAFRFYWEQDVKARPLLCTIVAYLRDPAFRLTAPYVQQLAQFEPAPYQDIQEILEEEYESRFSEASYKALAQHIASSWAQSGHLEGKKVKQRDRAKATPAAVAFAIEIAGFSGQPVEERLNTPYIKLLDVTNDRAIALAEDAGQRGWLRVRRLGHIVSVHVNPRS